MKKILIFLLLYNFSFSQDRNLDTIYFYFTFHKNEKVIKFWKSDAASDQFKLININKDSIVFIGKSSYVKNNKPKRNLIVIDSEFDFSFLSFFKKVENKKVIFIICQDNKYRYIKIDEIFQYERSQN